MDRIHRWQRIGGPAVDGTGEGLEFRPLLVELRKFDDLALAFDGADLEPELVAQFGPALRAEDLDAPGRRRRRDRAEISGHAVLEAEQHRRRVVHVDFEKADRKSTRLNSSH